MALKLKGGYLKQKFKSGENKIKVITSKTLTEGDFEKIQEKISVVTEHGANYAQSLKYIDDNVVTPTGDNVVNEYKNYEIWLELEGSKPCVLKGKFHSDLEVMKQQLGGLTQWNGFTVKRITRKAVNEVIKD